MSKVRNEQDIFEWSGIHTPKASEYFEKNSFIKISHILPADVLSKLTSVSEQIKTSEYIHENGSQDNFPLSNRGLILPSVIFSSKDILNSLNSLTNSRLKKFNGRFYHFNSSSHHEWHSDVGGTRKLGLSLNLSKKSYQGGEFCIKNKDSENYSQIKLDYSESIIFKISPKLVHKGNTVGKDDIKKHIAGWFLE